ncbi:hypothetical protein AWENTII_008777 [Aspergillus wentii]
MDRNSAHGVKNASHQSAWRWFRSQFHMRPPDDEEDQNWWFASTAIPLIAASIGPLANVMSIAALITPWRNDIYYDKSDQFGLPVQEGFRDPRWCTALNATSLACGVFGNLFLLCNFTRAVRYIIALPASIILWLLATVILIGITAAMHIYQSPSPGQIYSEAYWSAVIAAVLYFILCIILMINMLGYFLGHYPQHFALTDDQRTLILQTMAFMVWLLVGAAIFQQAIGIPFSDALYFCDLTILTLGFGDITPQDSVARGLVLPYAVIGIIILGLAVGSIHRFGKQLRYENVVRKHIERKRQSTFERSTTYEPRSKEAELKRLGLPSRAMEEPIESTQQTSQISSKSRRRKRPIRSAIGALSRPKLLVMREEKDRFDAMRAIQRETIRFRRWTNLVFIIIIFGIFWSCGAIVFWKLENITYFEALYFGFCSLLTIGYGDIAPKTNAGRPFFFVWSLCAVPTMTVLISEMGDTIIAGFKHATNRVGEWTVLPQSEKHTSILSRFPRIFAFLKHREEKQRIAHGFPIGPDEEQATHPRQSLSDLARTPHTPSHPNSPTPRLCNSARNQRRPRRQTQILHLRRMG